MKINAALILTLFFLYGNYSACLYGQEDLWTKTFNVSKDDFVSAGTNQYFNLIPGYQLKLEGKEGDKNVTLFITVLNETKTVDNVETRIVEEKELENGEIIEISRNYFAFNKKDSGIYYFGEAVDIYEDAKIIKHSGAWESGKNDASFGLMMPGTAQPGAQYYQEIAPGTAMDRAKIISVDDTLETPAGIFSSCLTTEETTPLEPANKEYKIYAPGIGLIKDGPLLLVEQSKTEE